MFLQWYRYVCMLNQPSIIGKPVRFSVNQSYCAVIWLTSDFWTTKCLPYLHPSWIRYMYTEHVYSASLRFWSVTSLLLNIIMETSDVFWSIDQSHMWRWMCSRLLHNILEKWQMWHSMIYLRQGQAEVVTRVMSAQKMECFCRQQKFFVLCAPWCTALSMKRLVIASFI